MRKSSVSKQSKHSSVSAAVSGRERRGDARTSCASAQPEARLGDTLGGRPCLGATSASGTTRVTRRFSFRFGGIEIRPSSSISSATAAPTRCAECRHLRVRHRESEVLDRRAEAGDSPQMRRSHTAAISEPTADADAVDLSDDRVRHPPSASSVACMTWP